MLFYDPAPKWRRKARRLQDFIMKTGNPGTDSDRSSYKKPYFIRKTISLWRRTKDTVNHIFIFPFDSIRFFPGILLVGLRAAANRE